MEEEIKKEVVETTKTEPEKATADVVKKVEPVEKETVKLSKNEELDALKNEIAELKRQLGSERAKALINKAEAEGKLTPAMLVEGSPYVELAQINPELFSRLMDVTPARIQQHDGKLHSYNARRELENRERGALDNEEKEITRANEIMADKGVDFAEAVRLARLEG